MALSETDIRHIARLSRIALDDAQVTQMTVDLNSIIEGLQPIKAVNLDGVEPTFHPLEGLVNVFRPDEIVEPLARDEALRNGSSVQDGAFLIPTILGGGDDA